MNKMNKAIFLYQTGDETCLRWEEEKEETLAELGEEEVIVKYKAKEEVTL